MHITVLAIICLAVAALAVSCSRPDEVAFTLVTDDCGGSLEVRDAGIAGVTVNLMENREAAGFPWFLRFIGRDLLGNPWQVETSAWVYTFCRVYSSDLDGNGIIDIVAHLPTSISRAPTTDLVAILFDEQGRPRFSSFLVVEEGDVVHDQQGMHHFIDANKNGRAEYHAGPEERYEATQARWHSMQPIKGKEVTAQANAGSTNKPAWTGQYD